MRDTLAAVEDESGRPALTEESQNTLDRDVQQGHVEHLEHNLDHPFSVRLWVVRRLRQQDGMSRRIHLQFLEKGVFPELFHVLEILDDAILDWIVQSQFLTS